MDSMSTTVWTATLEQEVIRYWLDKKSAKDISDIFIARGLHFSRNAVMGKVSRLGIERAKVTICQPVPRSPTPYRSEAPRKPKPPRQQRAPEPIVPGLLDISPRMIPLVELESKECRFECSSSDAVGDFLFCGLPAKGGSSYCPCHHAITWVKPYSRPGSRPFPRAA